MNKDQLLGEDVIQRREKKWWEWLLPVIGMGAFFKEFWHFLWERKVWWMTPIVLFLALLAAIVMLGQGSAIAPLIYAIF